MFPARFKTPRLLMRPIAAADAEAVFETYAWDTEVTRYLTWRPHRDLQQTRSYIESCVANGAAPTYVIIDGARGTLIGAFALRRTSPFQLECGYLLARAEWGRGFMTEALSHVADWALGQPEIWRIRAVCDVDNPASARVMQKAGMEFEGVQRRRMIHPNLSSEPRDCLSYARTQ